MMHLRGYLEYRGGYHDKCGDILSTMGCSVPWGISSVPWGVILSTMGDIMTHAGDIMSTMGAVQYLGGCHPL